MLDGRVGLCFLLLADARSVSFRQELAHADEKPIRNSWRFEITYTRLVLGTEVSLQSVPSDFSIRRRMPSGSRIPISAIASARS